MAPELLRGTNVHLTIGKLIAVTATGLFLLASTASAQELTPLESAVSAEGESSAACPVAVGDRTLIELGSPQPCANYWDDDNIVWGTVWDDADNIVWGTVWEADDNIVWGTAWDDADNIVWGTMWDGDDNIVWGTGDESAAF